MALPRTIPWWGWLLIVLGVLGIALLSTALVIRQRGWHELNALTDRIRAEGRGLTPADLVAEAPEVDPARQERAWALVGSTGLYPEMRTKTWGMTALEPWLKDPAKLTQDSAQLLLDSASCRQQWRELRAEGPVVLSLLGWLKHDLPEPEKAGIAKMAACRIPNLMAMRQLANAFATEARLAPDPRSALAELDAVVGSCTPTGSLIDAMIAIAVSAIRDEAWLEAATRGIDPALWIVHQPEQRLAVLRSLRAERLSFGGGFYQDLKRGNYPPWEEFASSGTLPRLVNLGASALYPVVAPRDMAFYERWMLASEDLCQTNSGATSAQLGAMLVEMQKNRWQYWITAVGAPSCTESGICGTQAELNARRARLAALLAYALHQGTPLPASAADLSPEAQALAAPTAFIPGTQYLRLSPMRFRLWTDPKSPSTELFPASRISAPKPTKARFTHQSSSWLELDLAPMGP